MPVVVVAVEKLNTTAIGANNRYNCYNSYNHYNSYNRYNRHNGWAVQAVYILP